MAEDTEDIEGSSRTNQNGKNELWGCLQHTQALELVFPTPIPSFFLRCLTTSRKTKLDTQVKVVSILPLIKMLLWKGKTIKHGRRALEKKSL